MTQPLARGQLRSARIAPPVMRAKLRLLLLSSLPTGAQSFRADRKHREILRRLGLARFGRAIAVQSVVGVRHEELAGLIGRFQPTHVHITCHGLEDALVFEDRWGRPVELSFEKLRVALDGAPRLAFIALEACSSSSMAARLQRRGLTTIGMARRFDPESSDVFFATFYQSLAAGHTLHEAFTAGRLDLEVLSTLTARIPRLFYDAADDKPFAFDPDDDALPTGDGDPPQVALADPLHLVADGVASSRDFDLLTKLDEQWTVGGLLRLDGAPGSGRTRLLATWLARAAANRWYGATRVFAWSFEQVGGRNCGDVRAFIRALAEFLDDLTLAAADRSEWDLGRCIARLLRRERFLLILDGIPRLPGPADRPGSPEATMHPGLVALLRGLERAPYGLCIVTTTEPIQLADLQHHSLELTPLGSDDAADWLWSHGVVRAGQELERIGQALSGNLLALAWAAPARPDPSLAPRSDEASPLNHALALHRLGDREKALLAALALAGGTLDSAAVGRLLGAGTSPGDAPQFPFAVLDTLVRSGLIRAQRTGPVALVHWRLVGAIVDAGFVAHLPPTLDVDALLGCEPPPLDHTAASLPALAARLQALLRRDQGRRALDLYIGSIARHDPPRQWSLIGRTLGMYAEDLELLGLFFDAPWTRWRRCVADEAATDRAYLLHRAALALRHVGRVREALQPFAAATELYTAQRQPERVATCANDLAETLVSLGRFPDAAVRADQAISAARDHLGRCQADDPAALRHARVTLSLTLATRGLVAHRTGDEISAARMFADAEKETVAIAKLDEAQGEIVDRGDRYLFSRPGLQFWEHLLDRLEVCVEQGDETAAIYLEKQLSVRLSAATSWHGRKGIASVSASYHEFARARLLSARLPTQPERREATIDDAEKHFARTLALLHRNQYLWMVPEVLRARARLRIRAGDPVNAALDREEAAVLTARLGLAPA